LQRAEDPGEGRRGKMSTAAAADELTFACRCGRLKGHLTEADPARGTHLRCHCADCRRAADHFGMPGSRAEGIGLWQTTPDKVKIDEGAAYLRLMRLTDKGLLRWYAGCCDTPLFNTMATPKMPFVGVMTDCLADPERLGPVLAEGYVDTGDGRARHRNLGLAMRRLLRRAAGARLSGRWKDTPFFDMTTRRPVAEAKILASGS
jgi:hypothetical protein